MAAGEVDGPSPEELKPEAAPEPDPELQAPEATSEVVDLPVVEGDAEIEAEPARPAEGVHRPSVEVVQDDEPEAVTPPPQPQPAAPPKAQATPDPRPAAPPAQPPTSKPKPPPPAQPSRAQATPPAVDDKDKDAERARVKAEFERLISQKLGTPRPTPAKPQTPPESGPPSARIEPKIDTSPDALKAAFERLMAEKEQPKAPRPAAPPSGTPPSQPAKPIIPPSPPSVPPPAAKPQTPQASPAQPAPKPMAPEDFLAAFQKFAAEREAKSPETPKQAKTEPQIRTPELKKPEPPKAPAASEQDFAAAFERLAAQRAAKLPETEQQAQPPEPKKPEQPKQSSTDDSAFASAFQKLAAEREARAAKPSGQQASPGTKAPESKPAEPKKSEWMKPEPVEESAFASAFQRLAAERGVPDAVPVPEKPKEAAKQQPAAPPQAPRSETPPAPKQEKPAPVEAGKEPAAPPAPAPIAPPKPPAPAAPEQPARTPSELDAPWTPDDVSNLFETPSSQRAEPERKPVAPEAAAPKPSVAHIEAREGAAEAGGQAAEVEPEGKNKKQKRVKAAKPKKAKAEKPIRDEDRPDRKNGRGGLLTKGRDLLRDMGVGASSETVTVSLEHGYIKIMVSKKQEVLDYRVVEVNPRLFREGIVSDPRRMSGFLKVALEEMRHNVRSVLGTVPGYQTRVQNLTLPKARGLNPDEIVPREAQRSMGISPETSFLAWHRLPDTLENSQWMVLSATKRSVATLTTTLLAAGLKLSVVELRPLALARAVNRADAVIAWASADGCEAIVVRDWLPMSHQAAYWGAEPPVEGNVLVNRLTEVTERVVVTYDQQNPSTPLPEDTPLIVTGTPIGREPGIAGRVGAALGRDVDGLEPPLEMPEGFPVHDLVANLGLALWSA